MRNVRVELACQEKNVYSIRSMFSGLTTIDNFPSVKIMTSNSNGLTLATAQHV